MQGSFCLYIYQHGKNYYVSSFHAAAAATSIMAVKHWLKRNNHEFADIYST